MTVQAVLLRLWWMADKAGMKHFSPHDLRRSFVGELLDAVRISARCSNSRGTPT